MPVRAGTATPTFLLGSSVVSRMYLGGVQVYSADSSPVGPPAPPAPAPTPYGLTVVSGDASVVLQFQSQTGPSSFQIQYSTNDGATWTTVPAGYAYSQTVAGGVITGTATIGGLTNGSTYVFRVAGISTGGIGTYSVKSANAYPGAAPTVPSSVVASMRSSAPIVDLTWTGSTGTRPIRYLIQSSTDGGTTWTPAATFDVGTTCGLTGQTPGATYRYRIAATYVPLFLSGVSNPVSEYSASSNALTVTASAPYAPILSAEPAAAATAVAVDPPLWNGGSAVTECRVYVYVSSASRPSTPTQVFSGASGGSATLGGLTNGTEYRVDACAVNAAGAGEFATSTVTPLASIPPQVPSLSVDCSEESFPLSNSITVEYRKRAYVKWALSGYSSRPTPPLFEVEYKRTYDVSWTKWMYTVQSNTGASPPFYYAGIDVIPGAPYSARVREVSGMQASPWRYIYITC